MLLLKQDTIRKRRVDKKNVAKLNIGGNKGRKHKVETICDNAVYTKKSELGYHLLKLYYLISWKEYLKEENTWEPALVVQHLRKLISLFYRNHPNKPITTSKAINIIPPMARPIIRSTATTKFTKQKQKHLANSPNK